MNKDQILSQDLAAISAGAGCPWVPSRSTLDLGAGPGMIPLVGIPQEVVDELMAGRARLMGIMPSVAQVETTLGPRTWTYFIRRADGAIENRVTIVDPGRFDSVAITIDNKISTDFLMALSQWAFEAALESAA